MPERKVNAVVVGAGAGGGVVAKELSAAGLTVVLLERGGWPHFSDLYHDELTSQVYGTLRQALGPDDERNRRVVPEGDGVWRTVVPTEGAYGNIAACVGSGTAAYGAIAWRFMPQDFRLKSTYGPLEGSTLEDWPISYDDLEPCYEKAEWEIGVAGDHTESPFFPPRRKPYPMPPHPYNKPAIFLEPAARKLGYHPVHIPMLRNSVRYGGRPACIHCRACTGFICEVNAKNGTHNTVIPAAIATGNCELRIHSMAAEIIVDDRGRAQAVRYFDADDRERVQPADIIVVSCSATESARLLLNSRSRLFPQGVGNRHDLVGRNFQDHAYAGATGMFSEDIYDDAGPGATIAVIDFNHGMPGVRGGGALTNQFITPPYGFTKKRPPGEPSWGSAHKEFQRRNFRRLLGIHGPVQEMPVAGARVDVDLTVKDYWGLPVIRVSGTRHPYDLEVARQVASKAEAWLKEAGAARTWTSIPGMGRGLSSHQAGTCRMGNDPATSVTNRYGQVHDIDNLFVADASLHVTNGGFNPALTVMALGYWVSDYIKKEWRGTSFRS
jgi:choline dehydrogenase-like flavoprotein